MKTTNRTDKACLVSNRMKTTIKTIAAILLTFNFITFNCAAQIAAGTYTIPGDYATFNAAVTDLNTNGIQGNGPVIFSVADGTYNERISINAITGTSFADSVIFRSASGDSSQVILTADATGAGDNYTVQLNGASYVTFEKMSIRATDISYARAVVIVNNASNNNFLNNELTGVVATNTSTDLAVVYTSGTTDSMVFRNNKIQNGAYNIYMFNTVLYRGTVISSNEITNAYYNSIYVRYADAPVVTSNTITTTSTSSSYNIYLDRCANALKCTHNTIVNISNGYVIYLYFCNGTATDRGLIANNFVQAGTGTVNPTGIYCYRSTYQDFYHNSVNITGTGSSGNAFACGTSGSNIRLKNNIFANSSSNGGYAIYASPTTIIAESDYNYLYVASYCTGLGFWNGSRANLAAWQTASGMDANSLSNIAPGFVSSTDLHTNSPYIDNAGTDLSSVVTDDIDGEARPATPCMGADEYTTTASIPACLSGTYTIGTGGDFSSFTGAVDTLIRGGTCGNVVFKVLSATYNEQINITPPYQMSAGDSVIFESNTGDSSDVIISYAATGAADNYTVKLSGASYITFQKMSIRATGASYARAVVMSCGAGNNNFFNNEITGIVTTSSSDNLAVVYSTTTDSMVFRNNKIQNGSYNIYMNSSVFYKGTVISSNEITNAYYNGIYLVIADAPVVTSNTITTTSTSASYNGIYLLNCDNALQCTKNTITGISSGIIINLLSCDGTAVNRGLIANNFLQAGTGAANPIGISLSSSTYQDVYHNSVHTTGTISSGNAFFVSSGNNIRLKNNIFANSNGGYAIYVSPATAIAESDYNYLYVASYCTGLGYWNGNRINLTEWQAASGMDANSLSNIYPGFVSPTDLHTNSPYIDNAGTDLSSVVTDDIDGEVRPATPCIGADEYTSTESIIPCLSGTYYIGTGGDFLTFTGAVDTLIKGGTCGNVVFKVYSATYNEQISITPLYQMSAGDSVIFESNTGDSSDVIIRYAATGSADNYTVQLNGASYITFQKMTIEAAGASYERAVVMRCGSKRINLFNNKITVPVPDGGSSYGNIYGYEAYIDSVVIANNNIPNSIYGVYVGGGNSGYDSKGIKIISNEITGSTSNGIYVAYADAPLVNDNTVSMNAGGIEGKGIYLNSCDNALQCIGNAISFTAGGSYGIQMWGCTGTATDRGLIANNFVHAFVRNSYSAMDIVSSTYQDVYHNSVNATVTTSNTAPNKAFQVWGGGNNIRVKNNIFAMRGTGTGHAISAVSSVVSESDYNYFYVANYCYGLGYWNGTVAMNLAEWQTLSGMDANSLSVIDPGFVSETDLHTNSYFIDNAGTDLSSVVPDDIDGEARPVTPCIGADEYTSTEPAPPVGCLSGTYYIGTGGDFTTFSGAVDTLTKAGICDDVVFKVYSGTYNEQIELTTLLQSSSGDSIVFESSTGNPADVVLTYAATGGEDSYTLLINNLDYVTVQNMTIQSTSANGNAIEIRCGNKRINLLNNIITGSASTSVNAVYITDYSGNSSITNDSILINNNNIQNGNGGIYKPNGSGYSKGIIISNNTISGFLNYGLVLTNADAPVITSNTITSAAADSEYGINLNGCSNALQCTKNTINITDVNQAGLYIYSCAGTVTDRGLIANNFVYVDGWGSGGRPWGIYVNGSSYQNIYHNSVYIAAASSNNRILYATGGSNLYFKNNIFARGNNNLGLYIATPAAIAEMDYNDIYTGTGITGYWNGNRNTLADWQAASGMDANSIALDPLFTSSTDLHLTASSPVQLDAGTDLSAVVPDDIDGGARPVVPWMGADEYGVGLPIQLLYFKVSLQKDKTVLCEWETATEVDNDYFTVEKIGREAICCISAWNWQTIDTIKGAGNSNTPLKYSTIDKTPYQGTSYYRLKQVDFNGDFAYSDIRAINFQGIDVINMSPNPAEDKINTLLYSTENTIIRISIFNILGQKIAESKDLVFEGTTEITTDVSFLNKGYYMLEISTETGLYRVQKKLIVN